MEENTLESCELRKQEFDTMKLSDAIRKSVADCRAIEESNSSGKTGPYTLDMSNWVLTYTPDGVCKVCMAGAIMRGFIPQIDPGQKYAPSMFRSKTATRLCALDTVRSGGIYAAILRWGYHDSDITEDVRYKLDRWCVNLVIDEYFKTNLHFRWECYEELATILGDL